jgi:hypothetical protein
VSKCYIKRSYEIIYGTWKLKESTCILVDLEEISDIFSETFEYIFEFIENETVDFSL